MPTHGKIEAPLMAAPRQMRLTPAGASSDWLESNMQDDTCSVEDCVKTRKCKGYCWTHHYRWKAYGNPLTMGPRGPRGTIVADPVLRFWSKVRVTETCWLWEGEGARRRGGYASISMPRANGRRTSMLAHRLSWEWRHGRHVPDGLVIDHLCGMTACVNPDHLEAVTVQENSRRSASNRLMAQCSQGHAMEGANIALRGDGARYCRACFNEGQRNRRARYRAEKAARLWLETNNELATAEARALMEALLAAPHVRNYAHLDGAN